MVSQAVALNKICAALVISGSFSNSLKRVKVVILAAKLTVTFIASEQLNLGTVKTEECSEVTLLLFPKL